MENYYTTKIFTQSIKNSSRKFFLFVFSKLIPEIHYLRWIYNGSSESSTIHKDATVYPPFHLQNSSLGKATYLAKNAVVKNTTIGKYCSIGPNLLCGWGIHPTNGISTSPSFYSTKNQNHITYSKYDKIEETKPIIIGNDVFIGMNVTILDGINIGDGAVIGAGAVVSKDIPPYAIAVGSPIRIIKYRFKTEQIESLLRIQWWNFDDEQLKDVEGMFFDIDGFLKKYNLG